MSAPQPQNSHPRRRPFKGNGSPLSLHAMQLRKAGTFSSPKSLNNDICGLENQPFMPRRSPTSTESLEALIQDTHPSVSRVANLLKDFDEKLAGHKASSASGASILNDPEVLPVPSFMLDSTSLEDMCMDIDSKPEVVEHNAHEHASDSGLGSSIGSKYSKDTTQQPVLASTSNILKDDARTSSARESIHSSVTTHSAVTSSLTTLGGSEGKHTLGEYACNLIRDSIIKPILAEESLKDFHPLIQDVPRRIGEKSICNLRDLEKTLVFLAPVSGIRYLSESAKAYCILRGLKEFSASSASYLRFCERSIQLLHTTVDSLPERDQRLPTDRPYTNNYFLDLVEQIRRYAAIMAATRQKEAQGEQLDEMDYSRYDRAATFLFTRSANPSTNSDEKITLRGGLAHNGRPIELVREKDGKVIPLATGSENAYKKRSLSEEDIDDDEVMRSMARRRKSEKPGDVLHMCRDCKKEFKRPCDLTKHEKTHSRPWKCSEEKCKYFLLGWPTEKERDRHVNDKHSAAPAQYKCLYPPCTYASKRESNCKQHMEKAHGWEYVRSKSNGRKKSQAVGNSPATPLTPFLGTPQSAALATPITPFMASPSMPLMNEFDPYGFNTPAMSMQNFQDDFRRDSITTNGTYLTHSSGNSPVEPNSFLEAAVTPADISIDHTASLFTDCGMGSNNFHLGLQQHTPALSPQFNFNEPMFTMGGTQQAAGLTQLSPLAQPDLTLFSSEMHIDEGFGEQIESMDMQAFSRPTEDFTLFDPAPAGNMPMNSTANFFPDFNQVGGQFDSAPQQYSNTFYDPSELDDTLNQMLGFNSGNQ
ncbi:copper-binding transcription factor [Curvularia kusanoi]|uniref:Copper-binding transcription factor n=1 Tax=Curvularia kusanoi TaxID=90978 RepID=A0A9P4TEC2_CURKU|nr:copper-binding transcription factor [Curvularia kusanoi]